jgi:hypothetical protein
MKGHIAVPQTVDSAHRIQGAQIPKSLGFSLRPKLLLCRKLSLPDIAAPSMPTTRLDHNTCVTIQH